MSSGFYNIYILKQHVKIFTLKGGGGANSEQHPCAELVEVLPLKINKYRHMKRLMIITLFTIFACKCPGDALEKKNVLVQYTKGSCLGKCPVYDLWIYEDGSILYVGLENVEKLGEVKAQLPVKQLNNLKEVIDNIVLEEKYFKLKRDLAVTRLAYNDISIKYNSTALSGKLELLNNLLDGIARQVQKGSKID